MGSRSLRSVDFKAFSDAAKSNAPDAQAVKGSTQPIVPEMLGPITFSSRILPFQSYFDSTALQNAIQPQPPNTLIVNAPSNLTQKIETTPGYALGLHPSSETPIAVQFDVGGQPSASPVAFMKPGQIIRPFGQPRGMQKGAFSGFRWGIPFGWLGGGMAHLVIFQSPDADVLWPGNQEICFHRIRMKILAPANIPTVANVPKNWPQRFPWSQAQALISGSTFVQKGSPALAVTPTRTLMRLRNGALTDNASMRVIFAETDDFDAKTGSTDLSTTDSAYVDVQWPAQAVPAGAAGAGAAPFPVLSFNADSPIVRIRANDGGISLMDLSGGTLATEFVDIERYGTL